MSKIIENRPLYKIPIFLFAMKIPYLYNPHSSLTVYAWRIGGRINL